MVSYDANFYSEAANDMPMSAIIYIKDTFDRASGSYASLSAGETRERVLIHSETPMAFDHAASWLDCVPHFRYGHVPTQFLNCANEDRSTEGLNWCS